MEDAQELFFILTKFEKNYYNDLVNRFANVERKGDLYVFRNQLLAVVAMDNDMRENNNLPAKQQWIAKKINNIRENITRIDDEKIYLILHDKDVLGKLYNGPLNFSNEPSNPLNNYKKIYAFSHSNRMGTYLLNTMVDGRFLIELKKNFFK